MLHVGEQIEQSWKTYTNILVYTYVFKADCLVNIERYHN